uniref:Uncharacterized protein n=1 Tax=Kalanchoe fedtschenkoi TaxID=63787 RepID=A0A7N0VKR8_KALFE
MHPVLLCAKPRMKACLRLKVHPCLFIIVYHLISLDFFRRGLIKEILTIHVKLYSGLCIVTKIGLAGFLSWNEHWDHVPVRYTPIYCNASLRILINYLLPWPESCRIVFSKFLG